MILLDVLRGAVDRLLEQNAFVRGVAKLVKDGRLVGDADVLSLSAKHQQATKA